MGGGSFDAGAYRTFATSAASKPVHAIYTSRNMDKSLDPNGVKFRESLDSPDNPHSTPLIVGVDVTGSMGMISEAIAKHGLGTLFNGIIDRKPIEDPHVMFMAIGDANCDQAPLQVSQFEADNRIVEQLTKIYIEGGGGGNNFESYNLPWYFAAYHTITDSFNKRGKRGYLFTIGDEEAPAPLTIAQIKRFIGDTPQVEMSTEELLAATQRNWDVYHVIIEQGSHASTHLTQTVDSWTKLLGQHVIRLANYEALSETIVSAIEVAEGVDALKSSDAWGANGSVVYAAVKNLPPSRTPRLIGSSGAAA